MNHTLKCWSGPFNATWRGNKLFEIRRNDRDFKVGDAILLNEWDSERQEYTGRAMHVTVDYITHGPAWGLPSHLVVMSITPYYWLGPDRIQ